MEEPAVETVRLYGQPGAELMHDHPDEAIQAALGYEDPEGPTEVVIEEWSVHPPRYHLDIAYPIDRLLDDLEVRVCEEGGLGEVDEWFVASKEVMVAANALYDAIAATVTWRQADKLMATITYLVQFGFDTVEVDRVSA